MAGEDKIPAKQLIVITSQGVLTYTEQAPKEEKPKGWKRFFVKNWKPILEAIQIVFTCAAIAAAGCWFLLSDQATGKANCTQKLSTVEVTVNHTNLWWCSLEVKIENVSQVPITLKNARIFVECIEPRPADWSLDYNADLRTYEWNQLVFSNHKQNYALDDRIVPGGFEYEYFEFLLPDNIQIFRVTTYISQIDPGKAFGKLPEYESLKRSIYKMKDGQPVEISGSHD